MFSFFVVTLHAILRYSWTALRNEVIVSEIFLVFLIYFNFLETLATGIPFEMFFWIMQTKLFGMAEDATPPLAFGESSSPLGSEERSAVEALGPIGEDGAVAIRLSKAIERQASLRRKNMDKSVLDDIMGDPDDFQDLADCDLPSESDGVRRNDAVRAP